MVNTPVGDATVVPNCVVAAKTAEVPVANIFAFEISTGSVANVFNANSVTVNEVNTPLVTISIPII